MLEVFQLWLIEIISRTSHISRNLAGMRTQIGQLVWMKSQRTKLAIVSFISTQQSMAYLCNQPLNDDGLTVIIVNSFRPIVDPASDHATIADPFVVWSTFEGQQIQYTLFHSRLGN